MGAKMLRTHPFVSNALTELLKLILATTTVLVTVNLEEQAVIVQYCVTRVARLVQDLATLNVQNVLEQTTQLSDPNVCTI